MFRLLLIAVAGAVIYWSLPLAAHDGGWYWTALIAALFIFTRRKDASPFADAGVFFLLCELLSIGGLVWALPQLVTTPEDATVWSVLLASLWVYAWQAGDSFWLQLEKDWQIQLASIVAAGVGLYWLLPVVISGRAEWMQWAVFFLCLVVYTRRPEAPVAVTVQRPRPPLEEAGVPALRRQPSPALRETASVR